MGTCLSVGQVIRFPSHKIDQNQFIDLNNGMDLELFWVLSLNCFP